MQYVTAILGERKMPVLEKTPLRIETGTNTTRAATSDTRVAVRASRSYAGFLELPVPVVLLTLWLAGVALIGSCAAALYYLFWLLTAALAGL